MGNAYIMVVMGILAAKGLGFYRDMVFASTFGTGVMADIYFQVFGLVNLIFTGVGVALSTLVIKNINKTENIGKEREYAAQFLRKSIVWLFVAAVLLVAMASPVVKIILPELSGADADLAVKMMYIMAPSLIFVVVAYIISGILQNEKAYFITSIMSLPFNVAIIVSLMVPDVSIYTVGIVTTIGWFLHIAILLPSFYKKDYSFLKAKSQNLAKGEKNPEIIWIFISNMMFQFCFYADRAFVVGDEGIAATFNYGSNLFVTISSVFVVAMSTVVFPSISKNYEEGHKDYVNELLRYIITVMAAIFLPIILVVGLFGPDVIRLVYERGEFTAESTLAVSTVFFIYSLGILGYLAQELFNKVLYLAGKYKYSVVGTIAVIGCTLLTNFLIKTFVPNVPFMNTGLSAPSFWIAASTSLFLTGYAVLVAVGIKKVIGSYWKKSLLADLLKIFISGALAALVYVGFNILAPGFTHGYLTFAVPLVACGFVYMAALFATGVLKKLIKKDETQKGNA